MRASLLRWRELAASPPSGDAVASLESGKAGLSRAPLPSVLASFANEPLVGRDHEIGALREAIEPRPGRRAVLILGEPGIGKTRHAAAAVFGAR